jgi:transcription elongation factor Elf1
MWVIRIIGKCPGCKRENSFGNVNIHDNILLRGCSNCNYSIQIPLPELSKKIIYLDQFFLSHAFRSQLKSFVEAKEIIAELAHEQLLVCPYSPIHRMETLQWRHSDQERLLEFIKSTSRGNEFNIPYNIRSHQYVYSFRMFLNNDNDGVMINRQNAFLRDINNWEDYFWIDVTRHPIDTEKARKSKEDSVRKLLALFHEWRTQNTTFEQDQKFELIDGAKTLLQIYDEVTERLANDDFTVLFNKPEGAGLIEDLLLFDEDTLDIKNRSKRVIQFLNSKYYYEIPCEYISSGLFAALKQRVKKGHYLNEEKAKKKLSGVFYDIEFISIYTPYCDAMFIDNPMFDLVNEPKLSLTKKFNTSFFARKNWGEFLDYLTKIKEQKTPEIEWGLKLVQV